MRGKSSDRLPCDESVQVAASFVLPTGKVPIPGPSSQNQRRGHVVSPGVRCAALHKPHVTGIIVLHVCHR